MPMPVIKSAKKKLRKDRKREAANKAAKILFRKTLKLAEKSPTEANIKKAVKMIDKTAKNRLIHENKANRLKSKLAKLLKGKKTVVKTPAKTSKTAPKKPKAKK